MKVVPEIKMSLLSYRKQAAKNPIELRTKIFETYGDIAWKKIKGVNNYYMGHPVYAQYVLGEHQKKYIYKHPGLVEAFSPFIGHKGLFTSNDLEQWYKDRLIAKVSFNQKIYFEEYSHTIISICDEMLQQWEKNYKNMELVNIAEEIDKVVIKIVINTLFTQLKMDEAEEFAKFIPSIIEFIKIKLQFLLKPLWYFSSSRMEYEYALQYVRNLSIKLVRQRLEDDKKLDDILGNFIHEYRHLNKEELIQHLR